MADLDDDDRKLVIVDGVQHSVVALAKTELLLARQFFRASRARFRGQAPDSGGEALAVLGGQALKFLRGGRLDEQTIACHAA